MIFIAFWESDIPKTSNIIFMGCYSLLKSSLFIYFYGTIILTMINEINLSVFCRLYYHFQFSFLINL